MTTPIVEVTPVAANAMNYRVQFGSSTRAADGETGIVTFDTTDSTKLATGKSPITIFPTSVFPGVDGIFTGVPNAIVCKLISAAIHNTSDDTVVDYVTDDIIVSNYGRVVFKPDFIRFINSAVPDMAQVDKYYVYIVIEVAPAYTNPSGATPAYESKMIPIKIELSADLAIYPHSSPVDDRPYISYSSGENEQPNAD